MYKSIVLVLLLSLLAVPVLADNVSFTFQMQNAPGGIGDFSWTITTPNLGMTLDTKSWNAVSNPSMGGGCKISEILLMAEAQAYSFTTFFSPLCGGLFDSETSGISVTPGQFGTYKWSGTNPDNTHNFETLTIFRSDLPVTTPEPSVCTLLLVGLALLSKRFTIR
jgi:hypothetical protein